MCFEVLKLVAGDWATMGNIHLMTWARINKSFSGGWFMIGFTTSNGSGSKFKDKEFRLNDDLFFFNHPVRRALTYFYPYFIWITLDIYIYIWIC